MIIALLIFYTALMAFIALGMIVYEVLELKADERWASGFGLRAAEEKKRDSQSVLDPVAEFRMVVTNAEFKESKPTTVSDVSTISETRQKLLRLLPVTPFPILSYTDNPHDRKEIDSVMSAIKAQTRPKDVKN